LLVECDAAVAIEISADARTLRDCSMQSRHARNLRVRAPTLLIVGGNDVEVIELNRMVLPELRCEKQLVIVPGAGHLFEEPGALDQVARLAREWFERHLISIRLCLPKTESVAYPLKS
jgi:pimeloyl-ACP methyl ester carboxylesterase